MFWKKKSEWKIEFDKEIKAATDLSSVSTWEDEQRRVALRRGIRFFIRKCLNGSCVPLDGVLMTTSKRRSVRV